jgi:hypothetical protein
VAHRVAQMVVYNIMQPEIRETNHITATSRGDKGFGPTLQKTLQDIATQDGIKPFNIWFSLDPFRKRLPIILPTKGEHPTLRMILQPTKDNHRVQLVDMDKGTPGSRLTKWRSTIKWGILLSVDKMPTATIKDATAAIQQAHKQGKHTITCEFATISYQPLHPVEGSLMLYNDQLNAISQYLQFEPHTQATASI